MINIQSHLRKQRHKLVFLQPERVQKGSLRETEAQRELRLAGDLEGYYKARAAAAYAARALMVVKVSMNVVQRRS
ncbi:hypothetical protein [Microbulbifer sp. JMSA003]|uniref:hypothetical protein n=1 Tax=Microbulbifer sp. JMSA003 TaxID=3243369 RepID=UPI00403A3689